MSSEAFQGSRNPDLLPMNQVVRPDEEATWSFNESRT
jgi:hypothetical protein